MCIYLYMYMLGRLLLQVCRRCLTLRDSVCSCTSSQGRATEGCLGFRASASGLTPAPLGQYTQQLFAWYLGT